MPGSPVACNGCGARYGLSGALPDGEAAQFPKRSLNMGTPSDAGSSLGWTLGAVIRCATKGRASRIGLVRRRIAFAEVEGATAPAGADASPELCVSVEPGAPAKL